MNPTSTAAFFTPTLLRRAAALVLALGVIGACSDDEVAPAPVPYFGVAVTSLDGLSPDAAVELQCDGNLVVAVELSTSIPRVDFTLRPAGACGASKRCGFVRVEALSDADEVLGRVDTATTAAVLPIDLERLADVRHVRARLLSGVDKSPVLTQERTEVMGSVSPPSFTRSTDCPEPGGSGGAGGAGPSEGGAGGNGGSAPVEGGAPTAGGAPPEGGAPSGGGAPGAAGAPDLGGAAGDTTAAGATG